MEAFLRETMEGSAGFPIQIGGISGEKEAKGLFLGEVMERGVSEGAFSTETEASFVETNSDLLALMQGAAGLLVGRCTAIEPGTLVETGFLLENSASDRIIECGVIAMLVDGFFGIGVLNKVESC